MKFEEFKQMTTDEQHEWLEAQEQAGKDVVAVCKELGVERKVLMAIGHNCVKGKWMTMFIRSAAGNDFDPAHKDQTLSFFNHQPKPDEVEDGQHNLL